MQILSQRHWRAASEELVSDLEAQRPGSTLEPSDSFVSFGSHHALLSTRTWLTICALREHQSLVSYTDAGNVLTRSIVVRCCRFTTYRRSGLANGTLNSKRSRRSLKGNHSRSPVESLAVWRSFQNKTTFLQFQQLLIADFR